MDDEINGGKRPFGPHGEGCECEWDEEDDSEDGDEEEIESGSGLTPEEAHSLRVVDLSLGSMASTLVEHFLNGLDSATQSGNPLNRPQVIAMMSTLMTGYADAKETSSQIEYGLRLIARRRREEQEEEERQEQADSKDNTTVNLHDITELFTPPSMRSSDDDE